MTSVLITALPLTITLHSAFGLLTPRHIPLRPYGQSLSHFFGTVPPLLDRPFCPAPFNLLLCLYGPIDVLRHVPRSLRCPPRPRSRPASRYDELPFLVCHLSLQTPEGHDAAMIQSPEGELVSMLYGTLVATPSEMLDRAGASGVYFAFPDVSVRHVGRFRLKINVMRITG
jgi:hypothetical protein